MIDWRHHLEAAGRADEMVHLVRHFLLHLEPAERAELPACCRPEAVSGPDDVRRLGEAVTEKYWELRRAGRDPGIVQEAWIFFLRAALRLDRFEPAAAEAGR